MLCSAFGLTALGGWRSKDFENPALVAPPISIRAAPLHGPPPHQTPLQPDAIMSTSSASAPSRGIDDDGIEIDLADRRSSSSTRPRRDDARERIEVERRGPATAFEERGPLSRRSSATISGSCTAGGSKRKILEDFGLHPAEPDEDYGSPFGVLAGADDQFGPRLAHRLDQNAVERDAWSAASDIVEELRPPRLSAAASGRPTTRSRHRFCALSGLRLDRDGIADPCRDRVGLAASSRARLAETEFRSTPSAGLARHSGITPARRQTPRSWSAPGVGCEAAPFQRGRRARARKARSGDGK